MGCSREAREFLGFPARFDGGRYDVGGPYGAYSIWELASSRELPDLKRSRNAIQQPHRRLLSPFGPRSPSGPGSQLNIYAFDAF